MVTETGAAFPEADDRVERARRLILRHGRQATAFQILNPGISLSFSRDDTAVWGWVNAPRFRVVAGVPVCPQEKTQSLIRELCRDAGTARRRVCLFAAEPWVLRHWPPDIPQTRVLLGAQPAWSPRSWESKFQKHASLRAQLNRARNKSVQVKEWTSLSADELSQLHRCLEEWLTTRGLPPMHFLVEPETLERVYDRRVFVAQRQGHVVGFLIVSPVPARHGWLVEQIVRGRGAVNGTSELMLDTAVRALDAEGYEYITLGLAALSRQAGLDYSVNPAWLRFVFGWVRAHGCRFYNFEGLDAFKAKFQPDSWEPIYAVTNQSRFSPFALYAIASAFSEGSPVWMVAKALVKAIRTEGRWLRERIWTLAED